MGSIGSMLGFGGDDGSASSGTNYKAQGTQIDAPVTQGQVSRAYSNAASGVDQQQAFLNALQAQNGIANQSDVFAQQQALANQLQGVANGQGPNPAQAQLANATGANIANQAALMAGQRGAGANTGLIARQAAMQGGNLQQQAAGQGAALQAQQSLNALGALQGQQANMAGLAGNQVGQQAGALNAYNQAAQSQEAQLLGGINNQNQNRIAMQSNVNNANAGVANTVAKGQQDTQGGLLNGVASAIPVIGGFFSQGGEVKKFAEGGPVSNAGNFLYSSAPKPSQASAPMPQSPNFNSDDSQLKRGATTAGRNIASGLINMFTPAAPIAAVTGDSLTGQKAGMSSMMPFAQGGKVPAMVSPGELYLPPKEAREVAEKKANPLEKGEKIPGKPKVKGDSEKNDTVSKTLETGGVVIPRSVMQSKDPASEAAKFVQAHLSRYNMDKKSKK